MKHKKTRLAAAVLAASTCMFSGAAVATNGYFTHGIGAESKAMAGTGIGSNERLGPIVVASNPALGVFAADGWEAGVSFFSPRRSYEATASGNNGFGGTFSLGAGDFRSSSELFFIPHVAKNWKLDNGSAITFSFYGRGGMNTDWEDPSTTATSGICDPTGQGVVTGPGVYCAGPAGVDLSQAFMTVNYAGKIGDRFAWGIGPVVAIQLFEANGVASFAPFTQTFADAIANTGMPAPVTSLSNNGHDQSYGWGVAAGIWAGLTDRFSVGLAYQSQMSMGEFDEYADLFAEDGGFDIPSSAKFGASYIASDTLRINFDVEHIGYSDVDSVGNPLATIFSGCFTANPPLFPATDTCLGGPAGAGFGWDDVTVYKLGFAWASDDRNTLRFGYSFGEQPIQGSDALFNILAPGVMEQHFTVGWTHHTDRGGAFTFSMMYAPEVTLSGPNIFDATPAAPMTPPQTITLKMDQLEFEVAYRW